MTVPIREARPADVPILVSLIRALAAYERLADQVELTEASLDRALFGPRPHAEAVLAELDGEAAGFALYFPTFSTFLGRPGLYLEDLFVLPRWRKRGIGKALLRHLASLAVSRGCGRLEWSVLDWNQPAIGFYESLGAGPHRGWTVYRLAGPGLARLAGGAG